MFSAVLAESEYYDYDDFDYDSDDSDGIIYYLCLEIMVRF